jgi:predicted ester cyclase
MSLTSTVDAFWKAFEAGKIEEVFAQHVAPDVEFVMPGAPPMRGAAAVRGLWEAWRVAFPDMRHETLHAIESGETYAAETSFAGTHKGPLRGAQGEVPPTGKTIRWQSADVIRFRGGKIASWHVYHDQIPMLVQLGLMGG